MSTPIRDVLLKLCRREDLTRSEARDAFLHIMSGDAAEAQVGGLLVGLAAKGTTVEELVGDERAAEHEAGGDEEDEDAEAAPDDHGVPPRGHGAQPSPLFVSGGGGAGVSGGPSFSGPDNGGRRVSSWTCALAG